MIRTNAAAQHIDLKPPRRRELQDMRKDHLVQLVLELESKLDSYEERLDMLEEQDESENRVELLHERIVDMGLASGPLIHQTADYRRFLERAVKRRM